MAPMRRETAGAASLEAVRATILERVKANGYTTVSVADRAAPTLTYTVGLSTLRPDLPEIMVLGLPSHVAYTVLGAIAERLLTGGPPVFDSDIEGVIHGFPVRLREIAPDKFTKIGVVVRWYRKHCGNDPDAFLAAQLLWPDQQGRWPFESDFASPDAQPLL